MNWIIIALVVFIIVVIFYNYFRGWFLGVSTILVQSSINDAAVKNPVLLSTNMTTPASTRYSYGIWVYVNSWTTTEKLIFSRNNDIILYLDENSPTLYVQLGPRSSEKVDGPMKSKSLTSDTTQPIIGVTDNFPLQKWVFIVVSVDNYIVDVYLDGKLVKSVQIAQVNPDSNSNVYVGSGYDAYIANFQRWSYPLDPQTVWNSYMSGNGGSSLGSMLGVSNYHVHMNIMKGDTEQGKITFF